MAMPSNRKLLDGAGHHAPHLNRLAFFGDDIRESRIRCFELDAVCALVQIFEGLAELKISKHPNSLSA